MTAPADPHLQQARWHRGLEDLRRALDNDGYILDVAVGASGIVEVTVRAGPDACDDCLVPKSVFRDLVLDAWTEHGGEPIEPANVRVHYPGDAADSVGGAVSAAFSSRRHIVDDWVEAQRLAAEQGWTDGLPVIPPTPDRVRAHLDAVGLTPDEVVAEMPERNVVITAEGVAVNAVLAGSRPQDMRLIVPAVQAVADPEFKFNHLASLGSPWPLFLVSGPVVQEFGLHTDHYLFGPDAGRNAVISRAFSLTMRNLAWARNDGIQRGQWGNPIRWQCIVSEIPTSPWQSLAVRHGHPQDASILMAVSVFPAAPLQVATFDSRPERILDAVCHAISGFGGAQWTVGTYVLMLGPHHATAFAAAGWTPEAVSDYVMTNTRTTVADLKQRGAWGVTSDEDPRHLQSVLPEDRDRDVRLFGGDDTADAMLLTRSAIEGRRIGVEVVVTGGDAGQRPAVAVPYMVSTNPVIRRVLAPPASSNRRQ